MRESKPNYNNQVWIGRVGENAATSVIFPLIAGWEEDKQYNLIFKRPTDTAPYPCVINATENGVQWIPNSADLQYAGKGKAELILTGDNGKIVKSVIYTVSISAALDDSTVEPPEAWESYIEEILAAGAKVENMTATASVDNTSGIPAVSVTKTETADSYNLNFAFTGLKDSGGSTIVNWDAVATLSNITTIQVDVSSPVFDDLESMIAYEKSMYNAFMTNGHFEIIATIVSAPTAVQTRMPLGSKFVFHLDAPKFGESKLTAFWYVDSSTSPTTVVTGDIRAYYDTEPRHFLLRVIKTLTN